MAADPATSPHFARTTHEPSLAQDNWLSGVDNPMPDEVSTRWARGAPRGYVLHGSGVVPCPPFPFLGVEDVDKFRLDPFEQTIEVRRTDPGARETIRRHGHDEVGKTCRHYFQRKTTIAVLRLQVQRIKKRSFFVFAQHAPECRAALRHGDAISALSHAFGIETHVSCGQGEDERSPVAAGSLHFVDDGAGTQCRMPGKRKFFFDGKHPRVEYAWISRSSQEDRFELAEFLREPKHEPGAEPVRIGKDGETVARKRFTREDVDMAVTEFFHLRRYWTERGCRSLNPAIAVRQTDEASAAESVWALLRITGTPRRFLPAN
jgi:hypothetical protein